MVDNTKTRSREEEEEDDHSTVLPPLVNHSYKSIEDAGFSQEVWECLWSAPISQLAEGKKPSEMPTKPRQTSRKKEKKVPKQISQARRRRLTFTIPYIYSMHIHSFLYNLSYDNERNTSLADAAVHERACSILLIVVDN